MFENPFRRVSGGFRHCAGLTAALCLLAASASQLQAQTLVHRWSFDTLNDSVGTAHATLTGTANVTGGALVIPGGAVRANRANLPIGATLAAASSLTVETWFTSTANQAWAKVWMFGTPGGSAETSKYIDFTPFVGIAPNFPSASFKPATGEVNTRGGTNPATLATGTQVLSTVVYDDPGDQIRLYLNGTLADSVAWTGTISELGNTTQNFIGAAVFYGDVCFNGSVNEMRIWNGAMGDAQVAANSSAGPGTIAPRDPHLAAPAIVQANSNGSAITLNVPITNSATTNNLSVTGATLGGTDAAFFSVSSTLPLNIAPGATTNLVLAFNPLDQVGTFNANVTLQSNDPFKPQELVTLKVEVALPDLNVPAVLNLGPVANNAPTQSFNLSVGNTGQGELAVFDAVFIAGPNAPTHFQQFAVTRDFSGVDGPLLVAPQSSANLAFTFNPAGVRAGIKTGILRLSTDDPDAAESTIDIPVNVEVTAPAAAENPPVLAHRWSFTTDATDSVGSATAELIGANTKVEGGNLVLPGGTPRSAYAKVPIGATMASASSLTVEAWFTPATAGQTWSKVWMFGTQGASVGQSTFIDFTPHSGITPPAPSVSFRSAVQVVDTRAAPPGNPPAPAAATKYHTVVTFDSAADLISIYIDGSLVDSVAWTGEIFELGNTVENYIGAAVIFGDPDWAGTIGEMRIWRGAFTSANAAVSFSSGEDTLPDLNAVPSSVHIGSVQVSGGNLVLGGVTGLVNGQSYHLETGVTLQDFAAVPGSTFQGGNPIPSVPLNGPKRFVRIVDGATP